MKQTRLSLQSYFVVCMLLAPKSVLPCSPMATAAIRTNCSILKTFVIERAVHPGPSIQRYPARVKVLRMTAATQGIASHAYDRPWRFSEMRYKFIVCGLSTKCLYRSMGQLKYVYTIHLVRCVYPTIGRMMHSSHTFDVGIVRTICFCCAARYTKYMSGFMSMTLGGRYKAHS